MHGICGRWWDYLLPDVPPPGSIHRTGPQDVDTHFYLPYAHHLPRTFPTCCTCTASTLLVGRTRTSRLPGLQTSSPTPHHSSPTRHHACLRARAHRHTPAHHLPHACHAGRFAARCPAHRAPHHRVMPYHTATPLTRCHRTTYRAVPLGRSLFARTTMPAAVYVACGYGLPPRCTRGFGSDIRVVRAAADAPNVHRTAALRALPHCFASDLTGRAFAYRPLLHLPPFCPALRRTGANWVRFLRTQADGSGWTH